MIYAMDIISLLRRVLGRFRKDDFVNILQEWKFIDIDDVDVNLKKSAKIDIVYNICEKCRNKSIKVDDVAQLDLIYNQKHSNSKKWTVYKLSRAQDVTYDQVTVEPATFQDKLQQHLSLYFRHDLHTRTKDDELWLRICLHDGSAAQFMPSNVVYMVLHLRSSYIISSNIKVTHKDYILQALLTSLEYTEVKELKLSGKNLSSLTDMVLFQQSQGAFSQYRYNQADQNPLTSGRKVKRKESPPDVTDKRVFNENNAEKRARLSKTEETFGNNPQPVLEKLTYQLETRFHGDQHMPRIADNTAIIHCTVRFEGKNVLEGIKQLGPSGLANLPLPSHLANAHSFARNSIVLAEKSQHRSTPKKD
ncbi:centromere protein N-A-like isoform X1 [Ptychodera flava]|uniref:centromere protein N-A-like isoform X1 n=1 Tax=Ptychodera flava TaxID=63121 RepID=UPI00396A49F4